MCLLGSIWLHLVWVGSHQLLLSQYNIIWGWYIRILHMEVNWTGGVSAPESGLQAPHPPQLWLPSLSHTCQCSAWGLSPACGVCMSEPFLLTTATGEPERDSHSSSTGRPRLREIALWRYCFLAHAAIRCPDWESRNGLAYALLKEVGGIMPTGCSGIINEV